MVTPNTTPELEESQDISEKAADKNPTAPNPTPKYGSMIYVSFAVAAAVILVTGYFYWQNSQLDSRIAEVQAKTQEYQSRIDVLKKDPIVRAGELFSGQRDVIAKAIAKSNAATYVREMDRIQKDFGIYFDGFSFAQGKITTALIAQKGLDTDAVQKIIKFIGAYRAPKKADALSGSGNLFDLSPVYNVTGDEEKRNISVQFTVK